MSDAMGARTSGVAHPIRHTTPGPAVREVVHEAYSFACMRCGRGWEQSYDIEHHVDAEGRPFIVYRADGQRVPSPLSRPTCENCGSHVVRIMRAGQVSPFAARGYQPPAGPLLPAEDETPPAHGGAGYGGATAHPGPSATGRRHRHLTGLFHLRHHRHGTAAGTTAGPERAGEYGGHDGRDPAAETGAAETGGADGRIVASDDGIRPPHRS
ncbi:hypothetical protein [Streptomyces pactum]|uniref:hypothetical protein n=1 Tax=Streptomyces pactum TaxID=68249 RepID=UPI0037001DEE